MKTALTKTLSLTLFLLIFSTAIFNEMMPLVNVKGPSVDSVPMSNVASAVEGIGEIKNSGVPLQEIGLAIFSPLQTEVNTEITILVDETHDNWGTSGSPPAGFGSPRGSWTNFLDELQLQGYNIEKLTSGKITQSFLQNCDVLIIGTAWSEFTTDEIQAIVDFVSSGGGLFLTGVGWSWVQYHPSLTIKDFPMNSISSRFGLTFNNDIIQDPVNNNGDPKSPIFDVSENLLTTEVLQISATECYPSSINASVTAEIAIRGSESAHSKYYEQGSYPPLLFGVRHGFGKVVCLGHEGFLFDINLYEYNNLKLGLNIINWLVTSEKHPDLIISDISWEPSSPTVGDSVIFSYLIGNQGGMDAEVFTTALYIDGERIDVSARRPLSAGAIESCSFTYTWTTTEGSHTVEVVADDLNEIAESSENNNKMSKTFDVQLMDVDAEIMPVIITTGPDLSPKKFYLYLTNKGSENMEHVSVELKNITENIYLVEGREHVEYGEIPVTESSLGETYFEISEIFGISDLILEAAIKWSDSEGYHEGTIEFEVPNPSTDLTLDWSSLIWKILSSQIISILAKIVAVPTIPLSWLITEFTGGLYRDSFIVFVTDENGSPLENEVRTSLFEYWPWILVPPEHSILAKNGIVHWTDAENSLAEVKVINWDSYQSIYINPEAYDNLRTPEIPIISIVFHSDGKISWLAPPLIDVKLSNDVNTLQIKGESPINILLTDPQGNRVGYDFVSKQSVAEVPFAVYSGPGMEPQLITIQNPSKGKYKIEVFGTDEGPYKVTTSFLDPQGITISEREYEGETDEGTEQEIIVELSQDDKLQAPGSSHPGYIQYWFLFPIIVSIAILVAIYLIRRKKLQRK